ncbi:pectinesterase [Ranunculus cassubicifolius]
MSIVYQIAASFLLLLALASASNEDEGNMVQLVHEAVVGATKWTQASLGENKIVVGNVNTTYCSLSDCLKLYDNSEDRLNRLLVTPHGVNDKLAWLSGVLNNHKTCLDGLLEKNHSLPQEGKSLTILLYKALALYGRSGNNNTKISSPTSSSDDENAGILVSWDAETTRADYVVAQDGSGNFKTITEAVRAMDQRRQAQRVVIYVKSGVYVENVEIKRGMRNVMLVGDGIDKTIVTGTRNVVDGGTTYNSATFIVSGDGFWARDITFENTAGPQKHQAVAITVASDLSVFYRCSFKGYQDTLFLHSLRQFYRDCHIYGTVDIIFGDAAAVLQNCDIFVRRPMRHQANMITAQGRENPYSKTGISIHMSRVAPTSEFQAVKDVFNTFLGRPWKKYSRTVFLKTDLDGLIHPKGWTEWRGDFALSTLYYGEYMNLGRGASTRERVDWPGFHVINDPREAGGFTVSGFLQGESWIPASGVPFFPGL